MARSDIRQAYITGIESVNAQLVNDVVDIIMFILMTYIDTSGITVNVQTLQVHVGINDGALAIENKMIAAAKAFVLATYNVSLADGDVISLNLRRG